jgi:acyl CoA:acetate/3-ketoacid CoA transferase alpha subunit
MGAALTIAMTRHVVGLGDIPPEHVHTPGPFVHRVIHVPE